MALNNYIQLTDGEGPVFQVQVEGEAFEERIQHAQRIGFSTAKHTVIERGRAYREWRGMFWAPRQVKTPTLSSVTLPALLSLFRLRYLYLKDIRENENGIDEGEWVAVYWADAPVLEWEQVYHQTGRLSFHFIEKEGL